MLVATFGPTTEWVGKTISFENEQFMLEGYGVISAAGIMEYDGQGHLIWAGEGTRAWVGARASAAPLVPDRAVGANPAQQYQRQAGRPKADARTDGQRAAGLIGLLLLVGGLLLALYFAAIFDTSVAVDYQGSSFGMPERVNNIGLMQDRQIGIIVGLAAAVGGGVLMFIGRKQTPPQASAPVQRSATWQGETAATPDAGVVGDLERLTALHRSGALTDEEFAALKRKLTT